MLINRRKKPAQRLFPGLTGSVLTGPPTIEPKRGRPSISTAAMTSAERKRKSRENKKARENSLPAAPTTSPAVTRRWDEIISLIEDYRKNCSVIRPAAQYLRKLIRNDFLELAEEDQVGHLNGLIGILGDHIKLVVWRRENPELVRTERKPVIQISFDEFMKQLEERVQFLDSFRDRGQLLLDTRRLLGVKVPAGKTGLVTSGNIEKVDAAQHQKESGNAFMRRKKVRNSEKESEDAEFESFQPGNSSPLIRTEDHLAKIEHGERVSEKKEVAARNNPSETKSEKHATKHPGEAVEDPQADLWCGFFCGVCGDQVEGVHHRVLHIEKHSSADIRRFRDWHRANFRNGLTVGEVRDLYLARWKHFCQDRSDRERKLLERKRPEDSYDAAFFRNNRVADGILRAFCQKWKLFS